VNDSIGVEILEPVDDLTKYPMRLHLVETYSAVELGEKITSLD